MMYTLIPMKIPAEILVIGPIHHCGYIPLINDLKNKNNCKSVITVIEKRIRVIIYSAKKISKGDQLGYSYSRTDDFMDE